MTEAPMNILVRVPWVLTHSFLGYTPKDRIVQRVSLRLDAPGFSVENGLQKHSWLPPGRPARGPCRHQVRWGGKGAWVMVPSQRLRAHERVTLTCRGTGSCSLFLFSPRKPAVGCARAQQVPSCVCGAGTHKRRSGREHSANSKALSTCSVISLGPSLCRPLSVD